MLVKDAGPYLYMANVTLAVRIQTTPPFVLDCAYIIDAAELAVCRKVRALIKPKKLVSMQVASCRLLTETFDLTR